ncbi:hypothetical protein SDC9_206317 [bioreactor metagenome]|uniref:Uncharacterized protein n=1 Tax=bioreactor metagenome TaxID=1076179 RepID=A0A645J647_9ZZZZ
MTHERFPKREACHLGVGLVVQQPVERMFERFLFPAAVIIPVNVQRQPSHGFGQDPHAGVHRRHLHGGRFVHRLPAGRTAEEEAVAAAVEGILRFITGVEYRSKWIHASPLRNI